MNKVVFTIVAIILLNILPLIGQPDLLLHYKTWVLVAAAAMLWLSQPAFSTNDAKANRKSDRSSILIILVMSSTSVLFSNLEWAYFPSTFTSDVLTIVGLLLLAGGIFIRVWAIKTLGKHFTATAKVNSDHELIKDGPYRIVRHPSYLGAFMAIVGTPLFLNDKWSVLYVIAAMSLAYYVRITAEEKMLSEYFGEQYISYKATTKRIIPFIW